MAGRKRKNASFAARRIRISLSFPYSAATKEEWKTPETSQSGVFSPDQSTFDWIFFLFFFLLPFLSSHSFPSADVYSYRAPPFFLYNRRNQSAPLSHVSTHGRPFRKDDWVESPCSIPTGAVGNSTPAMVNISHPVQKLGGFRLNSKTNIFSIRFIYRWRQPSPVFFYCLVWQHSSTWADERSTSNGALFFSLFVLHFYCARELSIWNGAWHSATGRFFSLISNQESAVAREPWRAKCALSRHRARAGLRQSNGANQRELFKYKHHSSFSITCSQLFGQQR